VFFLGKQFIKPTVKLRILALLQALSENSRLSQTRLGKFCHTSSAMVHKYLAEMQGQGLVDFQPVDKKSYMYALTPKGVAERKTLMETYCSEMVQAYASLKQIVRRRLEPLTEEGITRVALFGAAETCEVVLTALQGSGCTVVGILDNASRKQGTRFHDHTVLPPESLAHLDAQAVIITSFARQDDIYRQLAAMPAMREKKIFTL